MYKLLPAAVAALALTLSVSCTGLLPNFLVHPPSPVQITAAAADSVDAANTLGEVVEELRASAHKLHQSKVLPLETDNTVQNFAIQFANVKDVGVAQINKATDALQLAAATAPMVAAATGITTALAKFSPAGLTGTAAVVGGNVPSLLTRAKSLLATLGGGK